MGMILAEAHLKLASISNLAYTLGQMVDRPCEEAVVSPAIQASSKCVGFPGPCTAYSLTDVVATYRKPVTEHRQSASALQVIRSTDKVSCIVQQVGASVNDMPRPCQVAYG